MDYEVIIIGGGPSGLGLAIELGQRGINCAVIERNHVPPPIPKGQNLTQRTMEHFQAWGIEDAVRAARTVPADQAGGLTAYGTLLSEWSYDWMPRRYVRPFYNADNERLPQYATEGVLRRRVAELSSVTLFYGARMTGLRQDADLVHVTFERDGREKTLSTPYAVGCDGSQSLVREAAGIEQLLSAHDRLMVLLVFTSRQLHAEVARYPGKSFYCVLTPELQGYWNFFGRVDFEGQWFFHAPLPCGANPKEHDFEAMLREAIGAPVDLAIHHKGFWDLRFAIANRYRSGRVFIAGDAAHSHPPYGGYGINTGLEDVRNLGWKLAATLRGWGGAELLASYDAERRPVFTSTAQDFIEHSIADDRDFLARFNPDFDRAAFEVAWEERASGATGVVDEFEPNYVGSPIIAAAGEPSAKGSHSHRARAGHHLSPQSLEDGTNVYDRLGPGFSLLILGRDDRHAHRFAEAAAARNLPLTIFLDPAEQARARYCSDMILVRPDQYVAWAGHAAAADVDPELVLDQAIGISPAPNRSTLVPSQRG